MTIPERIDFILNHHHAYLREHMPLMDQALQERGAPEALMRPWRTFFPFMESHMMKEEQILFPAARSLATGEKAEICGFEGPMQQMSFEHQEIERLMGELRAASPHAGPHQEALLAMMDDLERHARTEDDDLFPEIKKLGAAYTARQEQAEAEAEVKAARKIREMEGVRPARRSLRGRIKGALGRLLSAH